MAKNAPTTIDLKSYEYGTAQTVDKKGKVVRSKGNGDAVQRAMLVFKASGKDITQIVRANKLDATRYNPAKWENLGLLRMSVGNVLRGMVRKGEPVTIGDVVVKSLAQRVTVEGAPAPAAAKKKPARKAKSARGRKPKAQTEAAQAA